MKLISVIASSLDKSEEDVLRVLSQYYRVLAIELVNKGRVDTPLGRMYVNQNDSISITNQEETVSRELLCSMSESQIIDHLNEILLNS